MSQDKTSLLKHKTERTLEKSESQKNESDQQAKQIIKNIEIAFFCDKCCLSSSSNGVVQDHKLRIHDYTILKNEANPTFNCLNCKQSFTKNYVLQMHRKIHQVEWQFKCSQCDKTYTDASLFKNHKRTHLKKELTKCSMCGKWLTSKEGFKKNMPKFILQIIEIHNYTLVMNVTKRLKQLIVVTRTN